MNGWTDGWMDGWMEKERGVQDICLGKAGDVAVWKDAKWCISQLVSGRGKVATAKYNNRESQERHRLASRSQTTSHKVILPYKILV